MRVTVPRRLAARLAQALGRLLVPGGAPGTGRRSVFAGGCSGPSSSQCPPGAALFPALLSLPPLSG